MGAPEGCQDRRGARPDGHIGAGVADLLQRRIPAKRSRTRWPQRRRRGRGRESGVADARVGGRDERRVVVGVNVGVDRGNSYRLTDQHVNWEDFGEPGPLRERRYGW